MAFEALENGKTIPFTCTDENGEMQFYELDAHSKLEVGFVDGTKKIISFREFLELKKTPNPKPIDRILNVKVMD